MAAGDHPLAIGIVSAVVGAVVGGVVAFGAYIITNAAPFSVNLRADAWISDFTVRPPAKGSSTVVAIVEIHNPAGEPANECRLFLYSPASPATLKTQVLQKYTQMFDLEPGKSVDKSLSTQEIPGVPLAELRVSTGCQNTERGGKTPPSCTDGQTSLAGTTEPGGPCPLDPNPYPK